MKRAHPCAIMRLPHAWVAQLVEHSPEEGRVGGSSPPPSTMKLAITNVLAWAAKNERHLGALAFFFGFIVDLFAFTLLSVALVNLAFAVYLGLAVLAVVISHIFPRSHTYGHLLPRGISVLAPLFAQYAVGSLLSGFMIFYTKSATLAVAWPFLVFLALVFIGNEFFRTYYKFLAFQLTLLFFALYAYLIFAVPLLLNELGPRIFLYSTGLAVVAFLALLFLLYQLNRNELIRSFRTVLPGIAGITFVVSAAYFTGMVPPIPLTMPESQIAHSLERRDGNYVLETEPGLQWYEFYKTPTVHIQPGEPLYAYAAVAAPIRFSATVVHRWERFDLPTKKWISVSSISFPVTGGRSGGYRGYSTYTPKTPGKWRVSVSTPNGQVIGRIPFTLVLTTQTILLEEQLR